MLAFRLELSKTCIVLTFDGAQHELEDLFLSRFSRDRSGATDVMEDGKRRRAVRSMVCGCWKGGERGRWPKQVSVPCSWPCFVSVVLCPCSGHC